MDTIEALEPPAANRRLLFGLRRGPLTFSAGLVGGLTAVYLPLSIYPILDFNFVYAVTGAIGGLLGRGGTGLLAILAGAAAGSIVGLVVWAVLDLSGAQFIPLAAVIMAFTLPLLVGGGYLIVRVISRFADRRRS